jgi:hypothetical protein
MPNEPTMLPTLPCVAGRGDELLMRGGGDPSLPASLLRPFCNRARARQAASHPGSAGPRWVGPSLPQQLSMLLVACNQTELLLLASEAHDEATLNRTLAVVAIRPVWGQHEQLSPVVKFTMLPSAVEGSPNLRRTDSSR